MKRPHSFCQWLGFFLLLVAAEVVQGPAPGGPAPPLQGADLLRSRGKAALHASDFESAAEIFSQLGPSTMPQDSVDLAVALASLNKRLAALDVLMAATAASPPWSSLALPLSTNTFDALLVVPAVSHAILGRIMSASLIQRSLCLNPHVAAVASVAFSQQAHWMHLPPIEVVERCLAMLIWVNLAAKKAEFHTAMQTLHITYRQPPLTFRAVAQADWAVSGTDALRFHGSMLDQMLRFAFGMYEMAYTSINPSFRWLLSGSTHSHLERFLAVSRATPRWYETEQRNRSTTLRSASAVRPQVRLAILSSDLRRHSMGWILHGLLHSMPSPLLSVTAYQLGPVGAVHEYATEFSLLESHAANPDWSMQRPFHVGNLSDLAQAHALAARPFAESYCDASLWGHIGRLAASVNTFYTPGTWRTPTGFCQAMMPAVCKHLAGISDPVADVLHEMETVTRPHVLLDLNGQTIGKFPAILHARPAPIIVHAYSGPETTADPSAADWKIVDSFVVPPDLATCSSLFRQQDSRLQQVWCTSASLPQRYKGKCVSHTYTEALAYLNPPYFAYTFPSAKSVCKSNAEDVGVTRDLSACFSLRAAPGCANAEHWCGGSKRSKLLALHSTFKVQPLTWHGWMNMMRHLGRTVLWLLGSDPLIKARLRAQAAAHGIHASRVVFIRNAPRELHLRRMLCGTLFLDTWPYGAHSTAGDALRFGKPVLSLLGPTFASRVAGGLQDRWTLRQGSFLHVGTLANAHSSTEIEHVFVQLMSSVPGPTSDADKRRASYLNAALWADASGRAADRIGAEALPSPFDHVSLARRFERALHVMWDARRAAQSTGPGYDIVNDGWNGSSWDIERTKRDFHVVAAPE